MSLLPVMSYGAFDRAAFALADDGSLETPFLADHPWVNAQMIVRRAWPEHFSKKYNLRLVADTLDLNLDHHDAGSDAEVAARAVIMAAEKLEMNFEELIQRTKRPIMPRSHRSTSYEPGSEGPLAGEVITFTGALTIPRAEAAKMANELGAGVSAGTTKKTTILVVGTQDVFKIVGDKSAKHRKAEGLVSQGQTIEFLTESDFITILGR
jgi:DNA polymerase-3 subunit epsilon